MASIQIFNLYPAGSELFKDSENFMGELVDSELGTVNGGTGILKKNSPWCHPILLSPLCGSVLPHPIRPTLPPKF